MSMFINVESEEQIDESLLQFETKLHTTARKFHPIIVKVEASENYFVCTGKARFKYLSIIDAVDCCFKCIHILYNGVYPTESSTVWYFLQVYFYEIQTKKDTKFLGRCNDIISYLNRT